VRKGGNNEEIMEKKVERQKIRFFCPEEKWMKEGES